MNILDNIRVSPTETQWKVNINGKEVWIAKWIDYGFSFDYEIFKGKELLTEEEKDILVDWIDEQIL
jgi:hypothetical protein